MEQNLYYNVAKNLTFSASSHSAAVLLKQKYRNSVDFYIWSEACVNVKTSEEESMKQTHSQLKFSYFLSLKMYWSVFNQLKFRLTTKGYLGTILEYV